MTATTSSTTLVTIQPAFTSAKRLALAGFLAGYLGLTREAYTLDLRQFSGWCRARSLPLFAVRRVDIETFARELEARGHARATVTRRLCTIAGFYKYAVEEELLEHSPAAHVRRPRLDYESRHCPGPQRAWRYPGRCRARADRRACAGLPACAERAAGVGGDRRRY
jgi:integrase/recombinase XerD